MPIIIPETLPATKILQRENIFVMNETRAKTQDIRPLKICILNLMPDKITTETQLLRRLSNSIIQVDVTLLAIKSHVSKNTSQSHIGAFYKHFEDVKQEKFDGIIVTGAPIEHLQFEDVDYWPEMTDILDWCTTNVFSSLFICWASQAALYQYYGIEKEPLPKKLFGVFPHVKEQPNDKLFFGINDTFYVPHSRNTKSIEADIRACPALTVLASSEITGIHLLSANGGRRLFMTGHPEYDDDTLQREYLRDAGLVNVEIPQNYFKSNNPEEKIVNRWKSDASLFYLNWLNHYVYQETEYAL